ncbi:MAG: amidase [Gammaproteobacteria bacterium]|jgi:amidase
MSEEEITHKSACDLRAAVANRSLKASDITGAFLERIEKFNPALNAVCTLNPRALDEARASDERLAKGEPARPMEGVPVLVKDNIETAHLRTTFGSKLYVHHVPDADSVLVERLRSAGAIILGKTNTPEFAADINTSNLIFGQTRNPWDLNVTPGGSSGGSAAGVAAGFAPIGIGTDLGGSIRAPSAFSGLVGLRPSPGRVPVYPQEFAWDTLVSHVQGPMARSVEDVALAMSVLAGPDERDPSTLPETTLGYWDMPADFGGRLDEVTIAYAGDLDGVVPVDPQVEALVRTALSDIQALGCHVQEETFDASDLRTIISGTRSYNLIARLGQRYEDYGTSMTAPIINQVKAAKAVDVATVAAAERARTAYWHRVRALLERFEFIVTPTIGVPAFRLDEALPTEVGGQRVANFYDVILMTYAFSIMGLPALSVPCGSIGGLPVGMQIVGRRHRDDSVLALGAAYLAHHPEHMRRCPDIDPTTLRPVSEAFTPAGVPV